MALDEAISLSVRKGSSPPTLRLYGWEMPSVSIGLFQKISDIDLAYCTRKNLPVVRRPTGGRAILHGEELTYSFSSRNEGFFSKGLLDTYRQLGSALKCALVMLGLDISVKGDRAEAKNLMRSPLCFKSTSYGELSCMGKKLIGSAQKRWKECFLQQGSLPFVIDEKTTRKIFNIPSSADAKDGMIGLREAVPDIEPEKLKEVIRASFERTFRVRLLYSDPSPGEYHLARELEVRKYLSPEYTLQR
jgi:lipoate-protein ligase A